MSDEQVKVTDGRDVLTVPSGSAHALIALGWELVNKPDEKQPRSRTQ